LSVLENDPHPDVATMAKKVTDYIREQVRNYQFFKLKETIKVHPLGSRKYGYKGSVFIITSCLSVRKSDIHGVRKLFIGPTFVYNK